MLLIFSEIQIEAVLVKVRIFCFVTGGSFDLRKGRDRERGLPE